jgi:hypothetical protein
VRPRLWRGTGETLARALKPGPSMTAQLDGLSVSFALPRRAAPMLRLIDGRRSLAEIHTALAGSEAAPLAWETFKSDFNRLYGVLNGLNMLFLECGQLPAGR